MYEEFFGLSEKPFSIQPDPSFLYWGRTHRLAYAMLEYGVLNHAGISVITGEVGCGKTTLIHRLLDQLSDTHTVALLSNVQEGRGDLLSWVLMGLGQSFAGKSHVELFSQLQTFFIGEYAKGKRVVLIIDEAQNLSMDMLEELRLLSNINAGKDQLLQLILVGQPQLKGLLNRPELLQLAQRVGSDFHLTPLNNEEVHAYIETRLSIAGCRRRLFTERAIDLIAEQSRGVPRVINVIADTALVYAFSAEELAIGVETVRSVIRDKTDYGVFGIASDELTAPPLAPRAGAAPGTGPDAFVETPARAGPDAYDEYDDDPSPSGGVEASAASPAARYDAPETGRPLADPAPSGAAVASASGPALEAASETHPEPAAEPGPEPVLERAPEPVAEASAVTGVIIVGTNPKISPEAAIRSAGDSRAVVFAPVGAAPDALAAARRAGAVVVDGGERTLTTGGRARNAGYRQLKKIAPHLRYVQFIDADCALDPDWIATAEKFLNRRGEVTMVQGRTRTHKGGLVEGGSLAQQKKREAVGEIAVVDGGSALMRVDAFEAAGGFRGDLAACETQDLCVRQRRRGAHLWRLEADMQICEAKRPTIGRWWSQSMRRGFRTAFLASLHGGPPERLGVLDMARTVFWALIFPLGALAAAALAAVAVTVVSPATPQSFAAGGVLAVAAGIYGLKILASILLRGVWRPSAWRKGFYAVLGRFPEFLGVLGCWFGAKRAPRAG